jgi:hypothetical protein
MKKVILFFSVFLMLSLISIAQNETAVADDVLLELYRGARVTDVVDGLVTCGYMDVGVMDPEIAPLWRDVKGYEPPFCWYCSYSALWPPQTGQCIRVLILPNPKIMMFTDNGGECGTRSSPPNLFRNLLNPVR